MRTLHIPEVHFRMKLRSWYATMWYTPTWRYATMWYTRRYIYFSFFNVLLCLLSPSCNLWLIFKHLLPPKKTSAFSTACHFKGQFLKMTLPEKPLKGGYAHFNMYFFQSWLSDLDLWNAFCEVSLWGSLLFTLQRQKKVCTPGDEAIMKIHKKLFSGIPINFTFVVISPKLQRIWS